MRFGVLRVMRFGLLASVFSALAAETDEPAVWHPASDWPILKTYDRDHLYRIGLPVGGIGTGTVTFGGRGEWRNSYGRCLSCWGLLAALSGFDWDGRNGTMSFADVPGRHFWAVGGAWGTCVVNGAGEDDVRIAEGDLDIRQTRVGRGRRIRADGRIATERIETK